LRSPDFTSDDDVYEIAVFLELGIVSEDEYVRFFHRQSFAMKIDVFRVENLSKLLGKKIHVLSLNKVGLLLWTEPCHAVIINVLV